MEKKSSQKGLKEGDERFAVITPSNLVEDLKNIAYWDRKLIKDTVSAAFVAYITKWKKENPSLVVSGRVKGQPE